MPYIARNDTDVAIAVRDNAGKHIIQPGVSLVLDGNQHADVATAMGLSVEWSQTPVIIPGPVALPADESEEALKSKRKASVTVRDKGE